MIENKEQSTQFKSQPNQPLLPTNIGCVTYLNHPNSRSNYQSKIVVDIQQEIDEDQELLDMLIGNSNDSSIIIIDLQRPNSEYHYNKPHSLKEKPTEVKPSKCDIIPEVDEEKLKTLSIMSHSKTSTFNEDTKDNFNDHNTNLNTNLDNCKFNSLYKKKGIMLSERNNESPSNLNKQKNKIRRFNSGEGKKGIVELNKLILPILSNPKNKIANLEKTTEFSKKQLLYNSQNAIDEEELITPQPGNNPKNNPNGKSIYSQDTMNRAKVSSAPNHISNYSEQQTSFSKSTNYLDNIPQQKIKQLTKKRTTRHRYKSNMQLGNFLTSNSKRQFNKFIQIGPKNQTPYQRNQRELFMRVNPQYLLDIINQKQRPIFEAKE